jgi:hypothetical protein
MQPSPTTVSNLINEITDRHREIEDTILIGEKCTMIHEASYAYNELRTLITNDYLLPEELTLMTSIGSSWRRDLENYSDTMRSGREKCDTEAHRANLEELEDQIRDALNDLFADDIYPEDEGPSMA